MKVQTPQQQPPGRWDPCHDTRWATSAHVRIGIHGVDYSLLSGSATLALGATSTVVTVIALEDADTANEQATLTLTAGSYVIGSPGNATVTILPVTPQGGSLFRFR